MFVAVRLPKKIILFGCVICLTLFVLCLADRPSETAFSTTEPAKENRTLIIDPGHGGEDGGAVSGDGTVESHVNLAISERLCALLRFLGQETVMTRTEDISLHSPEADTLRRKKTSDLKNRVQYVNRFSHAVLLSIHQNSLPTAPSVRGAQAFYNTVGESAEMAESIQQALNQTINTAGEKSKKQIEATIYLFNHVDCPAILVECGFLSNAEETALLQREEHQKRIAAAVAAGYLSYGEL